VYFIQGGQDKKAPVKIGVAKNIKKRLDCLQTANYEKLILIAQIECSNRLEAYNIESYLHEGLSKRRIRGEWFATCMKRVDKLMINWYRDKELKVNFASDQRAEEELDIALLTSINGH